MLLLALSGWCRRPRWAQSIKVGAVVPLTGRYGAGGAQVRAGYEIAVEQINAAGGVTVAGKKMPIELVLLDDESDATKTVARLETLAAAGRGRLSRRLRLRPARGRRLGRREEQDRRTSASPSR